MSKLRVLLILVSITLGAAVVALGLTLTHIRAAAELPKLGKVPDFSLTERSGKTVGLKDLLGHVWVADFIFTSCSGPCPLLSRHMARLEKNDQLSGLRLVSISVDPTRDTSEALRAYAERYGASPDRWWFLTGPAPQIQSLVGDGFHLPLEASEDGSAAVLHSTRIALIDPEGEIRGYYDVLDEESRTQLVQAAQRLLESLPR